MIHWNSDQPPTERRNYKLTLMVWSHMDEYFLFNFLFYFKSYIFTFYFVQRKRHIARNFLTNKQHQMKNPKHFRHICDIVRSFFYSLVFIYCATNKKKKLVCFDTCTVERRHNAQGGTHIVY